MLKIVHFFAKSNECHLFSFRNEAIDWHKRCKISELQRLVGPGLRMGQPNAVYALPIPNSDAMIYSKSDFVESDKAVELYQKCLEVLPDLGKQKTLF